jgi:hypothetical protein
MTLSPFASPSDTGRRNRSAEDLRGQIQGLRSFAEQAVFLSVESASSYLAGNGYIYDVRSGKLIEIPEATAIGKAQVSRG